MWAGTEGSSQHLSWSVHDVSRHAPLQMKCTKVSIGDSHDLVHLISLPQTSMHVTHNVPAPLMHDHTDGRGVSAPLTLRFQLQMKKGHEVNYGKIFFLFSCIYKKSHCWAFGIFFALLVQPFSNNNPQNTSNCHRHLKRPLSLCFHSFGDNSPAKTQICYSVHLYNNT